MNQTDLHIYTYTQELLYVVKERVSKGMIGGLCEHSAFLTNHKPLTDDLVVKRYFYRNLPLRRKIYCWLIAENGTTMWWKRSDQQSRIKFLENILLKITQKIFLNAKYTE
jgi:hypothetical protein